MQAFFTPERIERYYDAAHKRTSVRSFRTDSLSERHDAEISQLARDLSGDGIRIGLLNDASQAFAGLTGLAFRGVNTVAAFIRENGASLFEVGYRGEAFALAAVAAGLGGCWVGGTYRRREAERLFGCNSREKIAVVFPYGVPAGKRSSNPTHRRKPFDKVCRQSGPAFDALPEWQKTAFRLGQIAPSSVNLQPWEFDATENGFILRMAGLRTNAAELDNGIAAFHLELGAAYHGVRGVWTHGTDKWQFTANEPYIDTVAQEKEAVL